MYNTQSIYILRNPAIKSQLQFKLLDMKTFVILLSIFLLVVDGQKKSNGYVSFFFLRHRNLQNICTEISFGIRSRESFIVCF